MVADMRLPSGRLMSAVVSAVPVSSMAKPYKAVAVTPADAKERGQFDALCAGAASSRQDGQADPGRPGLHGRAKSDSAENGIDLHGVKLPKAKKGFVLLLRC